MTVLQHNIHQGSLGGVKASSVTLNWKHWARIDGDSRTAAISRKEDRYLVDELCA